MVAIIKPHMLLTSLDKKKPMTTLLQITHVNFFAIKMCRSKRKIHIHIYNIHDVMKMKNKVAAIRDSNVSHKKKKNITNHHIPTLKQ